MPSKHEYEFLGPVIGPVAIIVVLPIVCYGLVFICNSNGCLGLHGTYMPGFPHHTPLISSEGFLAVAGWMAFQIAVHLMLPGPVVSGVQLANGNRLLYKLTGELSLSLLLCTK